MITLKQLTWSNAFSYGLNNKIDFTTSPLIQLVGKNGHGKSSIALILEEVLFNKNSKGIKKGDILNRYIKDKQYQIELVFNKDGCEYKIESKRGAQQQVKLFKGLEDISGHTATTTYKLIEQLIGIDHKTFSQIVYQSHAGSLEFLTSADTARKKFLIELLNLGKYTQAGEVFKQAAAEIGKDLTQAQAKLDTIQQWIAKYSKTNFKPKSYTPVSVLDDSLVAEASRLSTTIQDIEKTNKKITQNNTYKQLKDKINLLPVPNKPQNDISLSVTKKAEYDKTIQDATLFKKKMTALHGNCPTCLQNIDAEKTKNLIAEQDAVILIAKAQVERETTKIKTYNEELNNWNIAQRNQEDWEKYHQLIDTELPENLLDEAILQKQLKNLQQQIAKTKQDIANAEKHNQEVNVHNNRLDLIKSQIVEMEVELNEWTVKANQLNAKLNTINTLVKTFSTTGLVAYKIENLVKDLEGISNEYLGELSGGRFQISFQISGSDKLNVVITDNGIDIDILALSGGERARVNVATLLAIRKLMQSLSQSRINLLILDETIEALDVDGKEKLIEVLLKEESLNTILVSHGFSHPLLEKVHVVKQNNISKIDG
jgi:DNA repair exonuclease SbcCD ATPase subunit